MPLKDLLKKKAHIESQAHTPGAPGAPASPQLDPRFTIVRSDSHTEEILDFPASGSHLPSNLAVPLASPASPASTSSDTKEKRPSAWRRLSGAANRSRSPSEVKETPAESQPAMSPPKERRLSAIFHRHSTDSRSSRSASPSLPDELENIEDRGGDPDDSEARWEKRATVLAQGTGQLDLPPTSPKYVLPMPNIDGKVQGIGASISDERSDDDIQKAIQLHEAGDLEQSTLMFGRLADPQGSNHALSQVLYGLALRHGWGVPPNPPLAVTYLSLAARNSAAIESAALDSGLKKGGAAKGELVLAIYELANCYRMGLGIEKDPVAARRYFETAARLGDVDAMEQTARCYEEGVGGKKDKFKAAKYYRLAEEGGNKIVGNSWIWKPKYDSQQTT